MIQSVKIIVFILLWTGLTLSSTLASQEPGSSPQETVEQLLEAIQKIKIENDKGKAQNASEHTRHALNKLNMEWISAKALGKYWDERTQAEQKDFTQLLSQLFVHVAFPNSGKFFAELKIHYGKSTLSKDRATVPVKVVHTEEGEVGIDFHLRTTDKGQWKIVDVDLDEVSMRNNLRNQFYKILAKDGYPDLLRRMTEKLQESKG